MPCPSLRRRSLLAGAAATLAVPALAQTRATGRVTIAQFHDTSAAEQDVAKDFLIGSRAAWQDINARGGLRGRAVEHLAIEVDGTAGSVQQAWQVLREQASCVVLSGTVSDPVASHLTQLLRQDDVAIAHVAPWLQNSGVDPGDRTFAIFATRQDQIVHALRSLTLTGVQEVGAVLASSREAGLYRDELARAAVAAKLRLTTWTGDGNLVLLGQRLGPATPAILLFIGGTPELVQFTQGLGRQTRQRYVVAMADVNLQVVQQMGAGRTTPIIATQAVPMVTASLPIVRRYREVMARLFDEAPVALSLAGFIAARYAFDVLAEVHTVTRASALAAFQRRQERDVGGFRVSFDGQRRSANFVTQSMLTADGRVVG